MNGMPETGTTYVLFVYLGIESVKKSYVSVKKKLGLININFKRVPRLKHFHDHMFKFSL